MTIDEQCRKRGWLVRQNGTKWEISLPFRVPVKATFALTDLGFRGNLDSPELFGLLKSSYAIRTNGCPPGEFRSARSFIEDGTFFAWVQALLEEESARQDLSDEAEVLRRQSETERASIVSQRKGQAALRKLLIAKTGAKCMATGVAVPDLLVASHIKGWSECKDDDGRERLDIDNVLLLAANVDALFDHHYISFEPTSGKMIVSERISADTLRSFGLPPTGEGISIPVPKERQAHYLEWHLRIMREKDMAAQETMAML